MIVSAPNPPAGRQESHQLLDTSIQGPYDWSPLLFDSLPEPPFYQRGGGGHTALRASGTYLPTTTAWHLLIVVTVICHSTCLSPGH